MSDIALQLFSAYAARQPVRESSANKSGLIMRPARSRLSPSKLAKLVFLNFLNATSMQPRKRMTDQVGFRLA